jgi:hypothetical protein
MTFLMSLYILIVDGQEIINFNEWPSEWRKWFEALANLADHMEIADASEKAGWGDHLWHDNGYLHQSPLHRH